MSDTRFIAYMDAFRAATEHTGICEACQDDRPCEAGGPIHADFAARHAAWQAHKRGTAPAEATTWATPSYTVDVACVRRRNGVLEVLLIERGDAPFKGRLALPGGYVDEGETSRTAAVRELKEETRVWVPEAALTLVGVYDTPDRDPRGWTVSAAYWIEVPAGTEAVAGDDAAATRWVPLASPPEAMAFDHARILADTLRLTGDRRA
ncbi:NUDIX domain-containing protein [Kitasatospora griseola]|uniref:NUDIX domain-containing protein n=1 Tax=Kitasatospora griseola TaxID=2064 RepID=UPI000B2FE951|nr:NUDIX hydrolase [Kitasatospora griseola]